MVLNLGESRLNVAQRPVLGFHAAVMLLSEGLKVSQRLCSFQKCFIFIDDLESFISYKR